MFRPISFVLIACLLLADHGATNNVDPAGFGLWIAFLLGLVPIITLLLSPLFRTKKFGIEGMTLVILVSWSVALFAFAWAKFVRAFVGNQILVDEVLILLPVVVSLSLLWYLTSTVKDRFAWMIYKLRLEILLLLVLVLGFMAIREVAFYYGGVAYLETAEIAGLITFILFSPTYIRLMLSAIPMEDAILLHRVQEIGERAGARQPNILVLNTHGRLMNAFAIGVLFRRKTIILTDKLIDNLTQEELLAVARHEFAHHKFWHIPFLFLSMFSALIWSSYCISLLHFNPEALYGQSFQLLIMIFVFSIVSVKFERQADAYSAVDQSKADGSSTVTSHGVKSMSSSLQALAFSQNINLDRNDPLHGSIQSRQEHLEKLVGCPIKSVPINRTVRFVKIVIILSLVLGFIA